MQTRDIEDSDIEPYSQYIMDNCAGDRLICNGDMLVGAIEDGYLWEDYLDSIGYYYE
jgi:hypothetical protein